MYVNASTTLSLLSQVLGSLHTACLLLSTKLNAVPVILQVAKDDLAVIRYSHPFDLEYYNIYKPPEGVEKEEAKRIRELYKYDIVSA